MSSSIPLPPSTAKSTMFPRAIRVVGGNGEKRLRDSSLRKLLEDANMLDAESLDFAESESGWNWSVVEKRGTKKNDQSADDLDDFAHVFLQTLTAKHTIQQTRRSVAHALGCYSHPYIHFKMMKHSSLDDDDSPFSMLPRREILARLQQGSTRPRRRQMMTQLCDQMTNLQLTDASVSSMASDTSSVFSITSRSSDSSVSSSSTVTNVDDDDDDADDDDDRYQDRSYYEYGAAAFLCHYLRTISVDALDDIVSIPLIFHQQTRLTFGSGQGSISFNAFTDGFISDRRVKGADYRDTWIFYQVKLDRRSTLTAEAKEKLHNEEICKIAAWVYQRARCPTNSRKWFPFLSLDDTELYFLIAYAPFPWQKYIHTPKALVSPPAPSKELGQDDFLTVYEFGPFDLTSEMDMQSVHVMVLGMFRYEGQKE